MFAANRRRARRTWIIGSIVGVAVLALAIGYWWQSRGVGTPCKTDSDCDSQMCLVVGFDSPLGFEAIGEGTCTKRCDLNLDCPDDMVCIEGTRGGGSVFTGQSALTYCAPMEGALVLEALDQPISPLPDPSEETASPDQREGNAPR